MSLIVAKTGRGSLVEAVVDPLNLYRAWDSVRASGTSGGVPSKELLGLAGNLDAHLTQLRVQVLDGSYQPRPVQRIEIPKPSGGIRRLGIPPVTDRLLERAVAQVLMEVLDPLMSPWSFAYRRGLGVDDAVRAVAEFQGHGLATVVRADIAECFDSIDRSALLGRLEESLADERLTSLVGRLMDRPSRVGGRLVDTAQGIHQGSPLSPVLCNLYLDRLDQATVGAGLLSVRFADDVAIGARDRAHAAEVLDVVTGLVDDIGLRLADPKTRIASFAEGVAFLGVEIGERLPSADSPSAEPDRCVLYLATPGCRASLRDGQLRVEQGGKVVLSVPVGRVGQIVAVGGVGITAGLRYHAMTKGLEVTFMTRRGRWVGRLDSPKLASVSLRRTQYRRLDDPDFCLAVSRAIVAGKIANQRALLLRHRHPGETSEVLVDAAERLRSARASAEACESTGELRGVEGAASRTYFGALAELLPVEAGFSGRARRPPRDLINACLSFGYTLLVGETVGALAAAGLDPYLGVMHTSGGGRPALALDLMEEFRPLIVDAAVLRAVRTHVLGTEHVKVEPAGAALFTAEGRRRFFRTFETRMLTVFSHVPSGQRTWYRRGLLLQARQLAGVVDGRLARYQPVPWR